MLCSRPWWTRKITLARARKQIDFLNKNAERSPDNGKINRCGLSSGLFQRKAIFRRPVVRIPSLARQSINNNTNNTNCQSIFDETNKESIISASKSRKELNKGLLSVSERGNAAFWECKPFVRQAEWLFNHNVKSVIKNEVSVISQTNNKNFESTSVYSKSRTPNSQTETEDIIHRQSVDDGCTTSGDNQQQSFPIFIKEVLSKIPNAPYTSNLEDNFSIAEQISLLKSQHANLLSSDISPESLKTAEILLSFYPGIERKERLNEVQQFKSETFESLIQKGGEIDKINLLIKQRALDGNLTDCLEILNKMKIYGLNPSVQTYNNVLLSTCALKNPKSARFIYLKMVAESLTPDIKTFSILIKTHVLARDLNSAFALQRKMERDGIASDVVVFSILIDGLVNNGHVDRAWETYNYARTWRLIEPDQVLFTIMIKACYKNGEVEKALNLYDEMIAMGLHPTDLTYTTLIKSMGKRKGFMDKAFHFYNLMKCEDMPITKSVYQHLLKCCGRNGVYSRAELTLNEYKNAGFQPEEVDIYHLIMSMKKGARVKGLSGVTIRKVFDMIKTAADGGVAITSVTLNGLIELYQAGGFYKYAIEVLEIFPHFNATPNQHTYEILLKFLGSELKEPGMFFNLWKLMRSKGVTPSHKLMCLALQVALMSGSSKMTLEVLREMYNLRIFPTPKLVTELYKRGKHIVEIHLAVKDLEELQRNLVQQRCKRETELLQSYVDERQLNSYAQGKKLNQPTMYHRLRSKTFKRLKQHT
ncbi:PPR repeat family [Babesia microti strain RI]|uniref:PPR repeat family n=1 Tax=Babesia microti (strain RI) TaxID=1133968 RepID=A0A1N6LYF7_BABMR|nr:PPR repeat family [Babesia microti strain RI]SIO73901.1 PPR repeat family [Babesia microti strain RI]|eukprot:XP_021337951.1 PPR repeat family [Babesia microti strain RI]